jgi:predicted mannosyl-3-phosphoglycerate phosphatase (HAD superfamily)
MALYEKTIPETTSKLTHPVVAKTFNPIEDSDDETIVINYIKEGKQKQKRSTIRTMLSETDADTLIALLEKIDDALMVTELKYTKTQEFTPDPEPLPPE